MGLLEDGWIFFLFFSIWLREEEENGNIYLRIALASNLTRLSFFFFYIDRS